MKKVLLIVMSLALFAAPGFAILHLGINAGYAYASMDELNAYYEDVKDYFGQNITKESLGNSIFVNADIDLGIMPIINIGPRVGLQYVFPSSIEFVDGPLNYKTTTNSLLIPLLFGFNVNLGIPLSSISFTFGAYAGYGKAMATVETTYDLSPWGEASYTLPYDGGGFMYDLAAAVEWGILPMFSLSLNAGYRRADIQNMNITKEVKLPNGYVVVEADEELKNDVTGLKMGVDFTGILVGLGLNFRF